MKINFHGLEITLECIPGDPSDPDPRYREDEVIITGVRIADEYEVMLFLWDRFDDAFSKEVSNGRKT